MDWPANLALPDGLVCITPFHGCSLGGAGGGLGTPASAVYPAANRALYIPFRISTPFLVKTLFCLNGAAVSGNIDVGIFGQAGARLVSAGSTPQAGTNAIQIFDVTDTLLGPGRFYLAVAMDNGTGTLFRSAPTTVFPAGQGAAQQATAFALPATATLATYSSGYIPVIGACSGVVV